MNECTVVNRRMADFDVYIGRGSKWGNPFTTHDSGHRDIIEVVSSREESIERYAQWILEPGQLHLRESLVELQGKVLGCFCKPRPCHGDVLARMVNDL